MKVVIKAFRSILNVLYSSFNNAFFKLLYTTNEDDDLISKICRLDKDIMYHRLWKLGALHIHLQC